MTATITRSHSGDHWVWSVKVPVDGNTVLRADGAALTKKKAKVRVAEWVGLLTKQARKEV